MESIVLNQYNFRRLRGVALSLASTLALLLSLNVPVCFAYANPSMKEERLVTIQKQDQSLLQALESVAEQMDIEIVFNGAEPSVKLDISIQHSNLDRAISKIMRLYGVENKAILYDAKNDRLVQLVIHGYKSMKGEVWTSPDITLNKLEDHSPLTLAQTDMLASQSQQMQAEMQDKMKPLTPEQLKQLQDKSAEIVLKEEMIIVPLTEEHLEQLKNKNRSIELEEEERRQPLTPAQIQKLKENSDKIAGEMGSMEGKPPQPLTEKQMILLQDNTNK
jgi:hypothetical protein